MENSADLFWFQNARFVLMQMRKCTALPTKIHLVRFHITVSLEVEGNEAAVSVSAAENTFSGFY